VSDTYSERVFLFFCGVRTKFLCLNGLPDKEAFNVAERFVVPEVHFPNISDFSLTLTATQAVFHNVYSFLWLVVATFLEVAPSVFAPLLQTL